VALLDPQALLLAVVSLQALAAIDTTPLPAATGLVPTSIVQALDHPLPHTVAQAWIALTPLDDGTAPVTPIPRDPDQGHPCPGAAVAAPATEIMTTHVGITAVAAVAVAVAAAVMRITKVAVDHVVQPVGAGPTDSALCPHDLHVTIVVILRTNQGGMAVAVRGKMSDT
jgi:hypothetical protein